MGVIKSIFIIVVLISITFIVTTLLLGHNPIANTTNNEESVEKTATYQ